MGRDLAQRAADQRNQPANGAAPQTLAQQIQSMETQFQRAMPRGAEAGQLVRDAMTCLRATPDLASCYTPSVLGGLMTCAQLALRPGVAGLGHAWLIPMWNGRERRKDATLIIGYRGYTELAYRHDKVVSIASRVVYTNDEFDLSYGIEGDTLLHRPALDGSRGEPRLYYALARLRGGYALTEPWTQEDMNAHRDRYAMAKKKDGTIVGPWSDPAQAVEMARKGLAVDTPIPTVSGWSTMGDLKVGDRVFDMHGKPSRVTAVSEVKHIDCYRVTFANGASIVCDGEHYWLANTSLNAARRTREKGWGVYQIADLYAAKQAGERVVMPIVGALATEPADLLIDPWMLGYWLGNGAKANARVTCHADHLEDIRSAIEATKYTVGAIHSVPQSLGVTVGVRGLSKDLAELGLIGHKHIPARYMRASAEQRLALLSGLLDSDGHMSADRGMVRFASVDQELSDGVAELARSLGEVVHLIERDTTGYGKTVRVYEVAWKPNVCPVTIRAKASRFRPRKVKSYRGVKSIERVPSVPTRCIEVDSETRTYAAGTEMVPTHNTMIRNPLLKMIPISTELAAAVSVDEGVRVDITPDVDPAEVTAPPSIPGELEEGDPDGLADADADAAAQAAAEERREGGGDQ